MVTGTTERDYGSLGTPMSSTNADCERNLQKDVERLRAWFGELPHHSDELEQELQQEAWSDFLRQGAEFECARRTRGEQSPIQEGYSLTQDWATVYRLAKEYLEADWPRSRRVTGWLTAATLDLSVQSVRRFRKLVAINASGIAIPVLLVGAYVAHSIPASIFWATFAAASLAPVVCWWWSAICFNVLLGPEKGPSDLGVRAVFPSTIHSLQAIRDEAASDGWSSVEIARRLRHLDQRGVALPRYVFGLLEDGNSNSQAGRQGQ
jgi:hypothetical protein